MSPPITAMSENVLLTSFPTNLSAAKFPKPSVIFPGSKGCPPGNISANSPIAVPRPGAPSSLAAAALSPKRD